MQISNHNRGELSNIFGRVRNGGTRPHQGWDLAAPVGAPVFSIASGIVCYVKEGGAYGLQVCIQFSRMKTGQMYMSSDTDLFAFYAHLASACVVEGQLVSEGQQVGTVGQSGNAGFTPPHLHFEIRTRPNAGRGLRHRLDPGEVLGFDHLACRDAFVCPVWE